MPRAQRARARLAFERATLGDFDAYELHVVAMLGEAQVAGRPHAKIRPLLMASLAAVNRGDLTESQSLTTEAQQLLSLTDDAGLSLSYRAHQLSRAVQMHLDSELEEIATSLLRMVQGVPLADVTLAGLRGMIYSRLEQLEPAREALHAFWSRLTPGIGMFLSVVAENAAFVGDPEICRGCHALLLQQPGTDALGGHVSVSYEGPWTRLLGLVESALGQHETAEKRLREALVAERRSFHSWVAQGRYDLARALTRANRSAEARSLLQGAAELAEQCQMVGLAARARARLTPDGGATLSAR